MNLLSVVLTIVALSNTAIAASELKVVGTWNVYEDTTDPDSCYTDMQMDVVIDVTYPRTDEGDYFTRYGTVTYNIKGPDSAWFAWGVGNTQMTGLAMTFDAGSDTTQVYQISLV